MGGQLSPRLAGRVAGMLFILGGAFGAAPLPLFQPPGASRDVAALLGALTVVIGGIVYFAPWHRWPRRSTLTLVPIALVLITTSHLFARPEPYSYSIFFFLVFVWIGLAHPRWTSVWWMPPAALAFVLPLLEQEGGWDPGVASVALVIPVCAFAAEAIAWVGARELRSRERTEALARVGAALGPHLNTEAVCSTIAQEMRMALKSEAAMFAQLDSSTRTIARVFVDGNPKVAEIMEGLEGRHYDVPRMDELLGGSAVVVEDTAEGEHLLPDPERSAVRSYLAVPVMVGHQLLGVLACGESSGARAYRAEDLSLARALANQASAALRNSMLFEHTQQAALHDSLTGLGNRRAFHECLEAEATRAQRYGRPLSLIVLDVDGLKPVNDTGGHLAGDRVLARLARLLEQGSRREDGVFRIGGDEFALVLPETGSAGAALVAERLRRRIRRARLGVDGEIHMSASIGVSSSPDHGMEPDDLFERADTALYEVKWSGGDAVATAVRREASRAELRFGVDVRAVIDERRLVALYQPIVHLRSGSVLGYETFCRLDAAYGSTPTTTMFRAAAVLGIADELDRTCRQLALEGARALGDDELLFLNITPATLASSHFDTDELATSVRRAGLEVDRVVLEITEQDRDYEELGPTLEACQAAGFAIALDDFGALSGDLALVARIHFDYVKVDMAFVHGANGKQTQRRLLHGLLTLGRESRSLCIAEGIETLDDLELVREMGFDGAQGFFIKDPSPTFDPPKHLDLLRSGGTRASGTSEDRL